MDDFRLQASDSAVVDAGYSFGGETDVWVYLDAGGLCRDDGQWDIGAHQQGGSVC